MPLEVTVDEWTIDTDDNRRLRAAAVTLLGLPEVPPSTRHDLNRLDRLLSDARLPPPGARLPLWIPTRLNARLHRLLHLADIVLAQASVEHEAGSTQTHGFVVNMAWLFEKLVAQILSEQTSGLVSQDVLSLDTLGRLSIRPDLVFYDSHGPVAVGDTKYKLLDSDGKVPNADAYQLLAYCARLGLTTGHLIYAGGDPLPEPFDIDGTDIRLVIHAVDIRQSVSELESRVAVLERSITSSAEAPQAHRGLPRVATIATRWRRHD